MPFAEPFCQEIQPGVRYGILEIVPKGGEVRGQIGGFFQVFDSMALRLWFGAWMERGAQDSDDSMAIPIRLRSPM
jgi:hypothetical protein